MRHLVAWVITGAVIGWALRAMLPGGRRGLAMGIILGIVGAVVGGGIVYASGKAPGVGASTMGAALGTLAFGLAFVFYEARKGP